MLGLFCSVLPVVAYADKGGCALRTRRRYGEVYLDVRDDLVDAPCSSSSHVGTSEVRCNGRVMLSNPLFGSARRFLLRHKFCR